jgi:BlaI family transcriptional regulator, penicillinase repressor
MVRPKAKEITERELEVMHAFWQLGDSTVADIRDCLADSGRDLAYTTVATLVRILMEKGFVDQTDSERPFRYRPKRTFEDVSSSMVGELINSVFSGSREQLLLRVLDRRKLTPEEQAVLEDILRENQQ